MAEELEKLREHAQKIAKRENCFLYDLEWTGKGKGRTLRIFIDKDGSEGVSIDDCSNVSRGLDLVLDVEELVPGGTYQLEVSSPGLDRHLKELWHYEKVVGEKVLIHFNTAMGEFLSGRSDKDQKRKKIGGRVMGVADENVELMVLEGDQEESEDIIKIPFNFIHKARVMFAHPNPFSKKKQKGRKG